MSVERKNLQPNMTDYDQEAASFKWSCPVDFNFGRHVVDARAETNPDQAAILWVSSDGSRDERVTFGQVRDRSDRVVHMLSSLGLEKGDRVLLIVHRTPEWHYLMVAMHKMGIIPMPGTNLLTPHDIEYRVNKAGAKAAIVAQEHADKVDAVKDQCPTLKVRMTLEGKKEGWASYEELYPQTPSTRPELPETFADEPMLIYFTSGTTSFPKMVLHTHASYGYAHIVTAKYWQDLREGDIHWTMSDTGWAKAAWGKIYGQWHLGACVFMHDARGKFDGAQALDFMQKYQISTFCAPPTAYRMMVLEDLSRWDLSSIRHSMSAGEPMNPEVIEQWKRATQTTIYDGYGQTETVNLIANYRCMEVRYGSMGKPVPGFEVEIVDEEGNLLPPNEEGHIAVRVEPRRPMGLMKEYWKDPNGNASAFRKGWYFTGDKATRDEDGYFWFVGRADDVIKASGYRVGPFEVESALQKHPAVAENAVVGSPDPVRGTIVKAFVVLVPGMTGSDALVKELQDFVKNETAPYKYPREIEFVTDLPKTVSGKVRRVELRDREIARKQSV